MSLEVIQQDFHMDHLDLQILRILADNCRTSYRSIGITLGLTTNTVKRRVKILIQNKIIEKFITNLNFAILGYKMNCLLIIRHHNSSLDEIAKYLHRFGNIHLRINAIGGMSVFGIIVRPSMEEEIKFLKETSHHDLLGVEKDSGTSINIRDIFIGYHTSNFKLIETDLKIIRCLLSDPRMKIMDITNTISASQRTVIRRMEAMAKNRLLNFGLVYNPSAMKGYNYFSILAQADKSLFSDIIKRIYADLSQYLLRHPRLIHKEDVIVLNLYSENVFDIESIFKKVESFPGVKKAEVFQPLDIKWEQDWMIREIDERLKK